MVNPRSRLAHGRLGYATARRKLHVRPVFNRVEIVPHKFARKFQINGKSACDKPYPGGARRSPPAITKNRPAAALRHSRGGGKRIAGEEADGTLFVRLDGNGIGHRSGPA